jgi:SRSO17 transposase
LEFLYLGYERFFVVGKKNQAEKASQYLSGLFQCERKKRNIERMIEKVHDSKYENLQHFISNSPWDTEGLMRSIAKNVSAKLQPHGIVACTVDEKAHIKKGNKSVGVARQYAGSSGKVENAQVGVYLSLTAGKYASLTNYRLFLPKEWISSEKRCKEAGLPKEKIVFKTKPEMGLEMIEEHINNGVYFDFINGDGLYGHGYHFGKGIDKLGKKYVLDVHNDQQIFLQEPRIFLPEKRPGQRGRNPVKLKTDTPAITVSEYNETLRKSDLKRVPIRKSTKGWIEAYIHTKEVWIWDKLNGDEQGIKQTLVIRRPIYKKDKMKFSLSNIGQHEQSQEMFAFMQAQRCWVEKCFRDDSHDLGMSDYQVRTFRGWNNHMALTCLAMEYVLTQKLEFKTSIPLLSYNDVRELFVERIQNNQTNFNIKFNQMLVRHHQRRNDIKQYYPKGEYFDLPK